jgi:hypothetical protein
MEVEVHLGRYIGGMIADLRTVTQMVADKEVSGLFGKIEGFPWWACLLLSTALCIPLFMVEGWVVGVVAVVTLYGYIRMVVRWLTMMERWKGRKHRWLVVLFGFLLMAMFTVFYVFLFLYERDIL